LSVSTPQLTLASLREANVRRCEAFGHAVEQWSAIRWALALFGEAGELANAVKKLIRGDGSKAAVAEEIADVLIYHDLLGARMNMTADEPSWSFDQVATEIARLSDCPIDVEHAVGLLGEAIGFTLYALRHEQHQHLPLAMCRVIWTTLALAAELGIDPDQAVIEKFNAVRRKVGSEVML